MIKLSLIKQILNVNDCKIVTSPTLEILGFFEVIKCNSEPPLLCSKDNFSFPAQYQRLAHYSEVVGSTDLLFGMKGSLMGLVEILEFQNTQRSEESFCFPDQN